MRDKILGNPGPAGVVIAFDDQRLGNLRPCRLVRGRGRLVEAHGPLARAIALFVQVDDVDARGGYASMGEVGDQFGGPLGTDAKDAGVHLDTRRDAEDRHRLVDDRRDIPRRPVPATEDDQVDLVV